MHHPHRSVITAITAIALIALVCARLLALPPLAARAHPLAQQPEPSPELQLAFDLAVARLNEHALLGEVYDLAESHEHGDWAYAIAQPIVGSGFGGNTPHTIVPMIGLREEKGWFIVLPTSTLKGAAEFNALLNNLPTALMDEQTRAFLQQPDDTAINTTQALNITGHKLPAPYNQPILVTTRDGSGHISQADFVARPPYVGEIVASKPGKVVFAKQSSNTGKCEFAAWKQTNMLVVEHAPNEFSWYLHLAYNSATVLVGDMVGYGTRIGLQGATGYSCGAHLHYMVSAGHTAWTNPNNPNAAPWATGIVPVNFQESAWLDIKVGQSYISQNRANDACNGPAQLQPTDNATFATSPVVLVWAALAGMSGCTFDRYTVRIKDTASMDSGGTTILDAAINALNATVAIPSTWNYRDLYWGVRAAASKDAAWSVRKLRIEPVVPGVYSLYGSTSFGGSALAGNRVITDLRTMNLDNWPRSMKLDAGVGVLVCRDANFKGTCGRAVGPRDIGNLNTLAAGLAGNVSSIRACAGDCPNGPALPRLTYPINGQVVYSGTLVAAQVQADVATTKYDAELSGGVLSQTLALDVLTDTIGLTGLTSTLPASNTPYALRVKASNDFGESDWAETIFVVAPLTTTASMTRNVFLPVVTRPDQ